ncbi:MAG TPA: succinate dehydrogenase/fumarate reductase iron-sulfur subunit [Actinomycetota bacterium]|jgi:succinate dehydrogenase / fumarate reductase iron-sulfur subunit|nr:succinate dehydrogenase/fumarate reductase iron-sulfur subunit [Actinomycetota bacterium]
MSQTTGASFRVFRWRQGDEAPHYDTFQVQTSPDTTVLEALLGIRTHQDPSLTLRHSCLHASCGTCGMRVNGREVLACVTPVAPLTEPVVVEPLANLPVVSDLVVDMGDFYAHLAPSGRPLVRASELVAGSPGGSRFEDCLECGLCVSACPVGGSDPAYLGPAALAATWRVVAEPRGADPVAVLDRVDDQNGCWRCHVAMECSRVCPAGVDPAGAIMSLRHELVRRHLGGRRRPSRRRPDAKAKGVAP